MHTRINRYTMGSNTSSNNLLGSYPNIGKIQLFKNNLRIYLEQKRRGRNIKSKMIQRKKILQCRKSLGIWEKIEHSKKNFTTNFTYLLHISDIESNKVKQVLSPCCGSEFIAVSRKPGADHWAPIPLPFFFLALSQEIKGEKNIYIIP